MVATYYYKCVQIHIMYSESINKLYIYDDNDVSI